MSTSKELQSKALAKKELYQRAQDGDEKTLNHFIKEWGLKVYTNEEINVLNTYILNGRRRMGIETQQETETTLKESKPINIRDQEKMIELPNLNGSSTPALVNWIEDLGDSYFRAGLSYLGKYPYDGGSTEWVLKLDLEVGFKPMFCSLYWKEDC